MSEKKKEIAVGGQAVIEGVMMRGPEYIATAVRRKNGTIEVKREEFISTTKKNKLLGLPIIRGFASLIEMMKIGMKTLTFSADRASLDLEEEAEAKPPGIGDKIMEAGSMIFAFGLAFLLFFFLPYKIAELINLGEKSIFFNLFAGVIRIIFFVIYIVLISLMKDVKRVFQYHGAEHKSVFAYENNDTLIPGNIQKYPTLHPRCGTSFMFFVLLISILIFSLLDTAVMANFGTPPVLIRLAYHLPFIPFISGISYEVLRFSGKQKDNLFVKIMMFPGISLQRITTQPPADDQVEVAAVALKAALGLDLSDKEVVWID